MCVSVPRFQVNLQNLDHFLRSDASPCRAGEAYLKILGPTEYEARYNPLTRDDLLRHLKIATSCRQWSPPTSKALLFHPECRIYSATETGLGLLLIICCMTIRRRAYPFEIVRAPSVHTVLGNFFCIADCCISSLCGAFYFPSVHCSIQSEGTIADSVSAVYTGPKA